MSAFPASKRQRRTLPSLPKMVLRHIYESLGARVFISIPSVCRLWREAFLTLTPATWKRIFHNSFGYALPPSPSSTDASTTPRADSTDWRSMCLSRLQAYRRYRVFNIRKNPPLHGRYMVIDHISRRQTVQRLSTPEFADDCDGDSDEIEMIPTLDDVCTSMTDIRLFPASSPFAKPIVIRIYDRCRKEQESGGLFVGALSIFRVRRVRMDDVSSGDAPSFGDEMRLLYALDYDSSLPFADEDGLRQVCDGARLVSKRKGPIGSATMLLRFLYWAGSPFAHARNAYAKELCAVEKWYKMTKAAERGFRAALGVDLVNDWRSLEDVLEADEWRAAEEEAEGEEEEEEEEDDAGFLDDGPMEGEAADGDEYGVDDDDEDDDDEDEDDFDNDED